jgi:hypothetical protein
MDFIVTPIRHKRYNKRGKEFKNRHPELCGAHIRLAFFGVGLHFLGVDKAKVPVPYSAQDGSF